MNDIRGRKEFYDYNSPNINFCDNDSQMTYTIGEIIKNTVGVVKIIEITTIPY